MECIDNGFIILRDVRIPKDNLLNKFSDIDENGVFHSSIQSGGKRFGMMLGSLSTGRATLSYMVECGLDVGLIITYRFLSQRRQFGPPKSPEVPLLSYPQVRYRLIPMIASSFAMKTAGKLVLNLWFENQKIIFDSNNPQLVELHAVLSAVKSFVTTTIMAYFQECRVLMGGLGFSTYAKIGSMRNNHDASVTYEGDNHVLTQQTTRFIINTLQKVKMGEKHDFKTLSCLTADGNFNVPCLDVSKPQEFFHLSNLDALLQFRLNRLAHLAMDSLQDAIGDCEGDMWKAWNQANAMDFYPTAESFYYTYVMGAAKMAVSQCPHTPTKAFLKKFVELWVIEKIHKDPKDYILGGILKEEHLMLIKKRIMELCNELVHEAGNYLEILAPPDEVIGSALARKDTSPYKSLLSHLLSMHTTFGRPAFWAELAH